MRSGALRGFLLVVLAMSVVACASLRSHEPISFESQGPLAGSWVPKVDSFVLVIDDSLSMNDLYRSERKIKLAKDVAASMNATLPELAFESGTRSFGQGGCLVKGKTSLIDGMGSYSSATMAASLDRFQCTGGRSPLHMALDAAGTDLDGASAAALVIVSDGLNMGKKELAAAEALKGRFGKRLCVYPIQVGESAAGRELLSEIAGTTGCGVVFNARDLARSAAMAAMVKKVFLWPDEDGDGVADHLDKCPGTPQGVEVDEVGCPLDTDGDGVPDYLDKCPETPAGVSVDAAGCPVDTDGDGVPDDLDKCPGTPAGAPVDADGCPLDTDGDGVPDYLDKCPGTARGVPVDEQGCPVKGIVIQGDEWTVSGQILFDTNKSDIKAAANEVLIQVAEFLKKNTQWTVEIQGHTDSTGPLAYNMALSARRAAAVKAYLVAQGVAADRFSTEGFGPNEPVADNATAAGRALNRRVDFKPSES